MDPELNVNIVDLGLIYGITVKNGTANILLTLTTPGCPLSPVFEAMIKEALKEVNGVNNVRVELTFIPPWTPDKMASQARTALGF